MNDAPRARLAAATIAFAWAAHFAATPAHAAGLPPARLDSLRAYVDGLAAFGFTGQVLVAEGDSILIRRAAGIANASGRRVGLQTRFALGSITKSLTGALAVRFAARGLMDLDQPISRYLAGVPADKADLTLRRLLTHTSGLPTDADAVDEDDTRDEVVAKTLDEPLRFEPGARFGYSNAGYQLLAAVLERVSGRPYTALVSSEILGPCGMLDSGTGAAAARATRDAAEGRNEWKSLGSPREWRQRWAGTGAGDLVSTGRDLWRWGRVLQGAGPFSAAELDTLLVRRVHVDDGLHYGFGVYAIPMAGAPDLVSVGGDVPGFHAGARFERQPPWRSTVVVMSGERFGRGLAITAVQRRLWRLLSGAPVSMPPETATWPRDQLLILAGVWTLSSGGVLDLVAEGDGLRLGLAGSDAMDIAYGADSTGERATLDARAAAVLSAVATPGDSVFVKVLHPLERELWENTIRSGYARALAKLGPLRETIVDGTVPLPWLDRGMRTYARLRFARGEQDVSFGWIGGALLDVTFGEGRPRPVLLPAAPLREGGLAAWDMLGGGVIRLEPFRDAHGPGLIVSGPTDRVIARRVAEK